MGLLTDFEFKSEYQKLEDDIAAEFYLPCMRNSVFYDRISGYFGSTIYIIAWNALKEFIQNGGHMRIICSPYISDDDALAIKEGNTAKTDAILSKALKDELDQILEKDNLAAPSRLLACLIAENIIEIKLAIARDGTRDPSLERLYHDKAGVFTDIAGNSVGFRGSFNETFKGLSDNGNIESADVFQSWDIGKDAGRVANIRNGFQKVWCGEYDVLEIHDLPSEAKKYIRDKASSYKWKELLDEVKVTVSRGDFWKPNKKKDIIRLKDHQVKALDAWDKQANRGIYQGCTGCGKTVIAISAIRHVLDQGKSCLVLVPSKELLDNWDKEIRRIIDDEPISVFLCGDGHDAWKRDGNLHLWTSRSNTSKKIVIAMMDTASKPEFQDQISQGSHLMVVADEVHRMGSPSRKSFFRIKYGSALGLSATPTRYGDPEGTQAILDYFGDIIDPPYTMKNALADKVLTPYYYHPVSISLTLTEQEEWDAITKRIAKQYAISQNNENSSAKDSFLQIMRIERARIIKRAANKVTAAVKIIKENYREGQKWLVYCEDKVQLGVVCDKIRSLGVDAYIYYSDMPGDPDNTLAYFAENGGVLVSIKCLDEGVDIPSTTHALVLASSKNPREFIQRRGRILRRSSNKNFSHLYDVIAVPNTAKVDDDKSLSIVVSELARAVEFGSSALNPACITDMHLIALKFGVDYKQFESEGFDEDEG